MVAASGPRRPHGHEDRRHDSSDLTEPDHTASDVRTGVVGSRARVGAYSRLFGVDAKHDRTRPRNRLARYQRRNASLVCPHESCRVSIVDERRTKRMSVTSEAQFTRTRLAQALHPTHIGAGGHEVLDAVDRDREYERVEWCAALFIRYQEFARASHTHTRPSQADDQTSGHPPDSTLTVHDFPVR